MFKGKQAKIDPNSTDTLIGEGSLFEGSIKSEAGIRIEGQITGDIDCLGDVTIGEKGIARSHIKARNVILAGQIIGDVVAKATLAIKATGKLHGNLTALEVTIESGGIFQGTSTMDFKEETPAVTEEKPPAQRESEARIPAPSGDDTVAVLKTW